MFKQLKEFFTGTKQTVPSTHVAKPFLYSDRAPVLVPTYEYLTSQRQRAPVREMNHPSIRQNSYLEQRADYSNDEYLLHAKSQPERPMLSNNPTAVLDRQQHY